MSFHWTLISDCTAYDNNNNHMDWSHTVSSSLKHVALWIFTKTVERFNPHSRLILKRQQILQFQCLNGTRYENDGNTSGKDGEWNAWRIKFIHKHWALEFRLQWAFKYLHLPGRWRKKGAQCMCSHILHIRCMCLHIVYAWRCSCLCQWNGNCIDFEMLTT